MKKTIKTVKKCKDNERQKAIEKELDCKFIRSNPDEEDCDMYLDIAESTKKSLIDDISKRKPDLKFHSNHLIKSKYYHHYKTMQTYCLSCRKYTDNIGSKK